MEMFARSFSITDLFALPTARAIVRFLSAKTSSPVSSAARDRAKLAQAGISRFRRPQTL
jgi:hypothetical protein